MYPHDKINQTKLTTNKNYYKVNIIKLKFWYLYNRYNEETAFLFLYKKPKLRNQIHTYIKFFNIKSNIFIDNKSTTNFFLAKFNTKICLYCSKPFVSKNASFCSVNCSNNYKISNPKYIENLSNGVKKYHESLTKDERDTRNKTISKGNKLFYTNETTEDKKVRLENTNTYHSLAWNNQIKYCKNNHLEIRFTEEDYINDKQLIYKCKKCNFVISLKNRGTTPPKPNCDKCNPRVKIKAKTQHSIYTKMLENSNSILYDKRRTISPLEIDIYDVKNNIAIEYDGMLSHSYGPSAVEYYNFNKNENKNYHLIKTELCLDKNIKLYHILEHEYINKNKQKIWLSMIFNKQKQSKIIDSNSCYVKEVNQKEANMFLLNNNLEGEVVNNSHIGLYNKDLLILMLSIQKINEIYIINRLTTKLNLSIPKGPYKLLEYFEKEYKPKKITVTTNRRWSEGNIYKKLGFEFVGNTEPRCFYFDIREMVLYEDNVFFDMYETIQNEEDAFKNGYRRIYDCGLTKYKKEY